MKGLKVLAIAAALAAPATVLAQARVSYPVERITVYEYQRHADFVGRYHGAFQSGGATAADTELADRVAEALAADRRLYGVGATVSAVNGRVSFTGTGNEAQDHIAQQVARRAANRTGGTVSGKLSPDVG